MLYGAWMDAARKAKMKLIGICFAVLTALLVSIAMAPARASSHREAPLISQDPTADNTDVYAFVSPADPGKVTLISNFIPLEAPSARAHPTTAA